MLGVGAAGTTHWSASFSVQAPGVVWCEYAARISRLWDRPSEWLGTRFRVAADWELRSDEKEWVLQQSSRRIGLQLLGTESQLEIIGPGEFAVFPSAARRQEAKTIEWKLAVGLV